MVEIMSFLNVLLKEWRVCVPASNNKPGLADQVGERARREEYLRALDAGTKKRIILEVGKVGIRLEKRES
jgi:hypothetical protein